MMEQGMELQEITRIYDNQLALIEDKVTQEHEIDLSKLQKSQSGETFPDQISPPK